jgi:ABC-2 type transport system permease protein
VAIHYAIMFLMATACFWWTRSEALMMAYYDLFSITRVPDSAFRGAIRSTFALGIPLLMIASVPAKILVGVLESPSQIGALIASSILWFCISQVVWERGLRAYRSAGS